MDGLTDFILRELAFEAGLGSDISRIPELISQHYAVFHPNVRQTVDERLCAFVWSLLVRQENVIVGRAPDGAVPVYFPPQMGNARKEKGKTQGEAAASLVPLASDELLSTPLDALVAKHGPGLRIAATPEICFLYTTGSRIRPDKLSGTVYAVLQLIARTRREGISVADISKQSGYGSKDCFALVRTLVELGHIHKIKVGGSAVNICIHQAFYDDECEWKQVEKEAADEPDQESGSCLASGAASIMGDDDEGKEFKSAVQFDPIDNRHLSNLPLIKSRVEKLLRQMPHGIHGYRNLLFAIGFNATSKKERRIFTHRVHELIKARFIEKVWAPSTTASSGRVLCIRLASDGSAASGEEVDVAEADAGDEAEVGSEEITQETIDQFEGTYGTQTIAHQIIAMIEESGTTGMTIAEISKRLDGFDLRSVTNLTARFRDGGPPTHLADRGLVIRTETYGREKRQRLFTHAAYLAMIERDHLEDASFTFTAEDLARTGGWAIFENEEFVADERAREAWLQDFVKGVFVESGARTKSKSKGKKVRKNPLDANGKPILGRPRKEWKAGNSADKGPPKKRGRPPKRKVEDMEGPAEPPVAKKRGRPPKAKPAVVGDVPVDAPDANGDKDKSVGVELTILEPTIQVQPEMNTADAQADSSGHPVAPVSHEQPSDLNDAERGPEGHSINPSEQPPQAAPTRRSTRLGKLKQTIQAEIPATRSSPTDTRLPSSPLRPSKRARLGPEVQPTTSQLSSTSAVQESPTLPAQPAASCLDGLERITEQEPQGPPSNQPATGHMEASAVTDGQVADIPQAKQLPAPDGPRQGRPANVSSLRRQTEFLQVIKAMGGVVNISLSKPFQDEHQKLLATLHASRENASAMPGTGMDRRTFTSTFDALESRGYIKTRAISTVTQVGVIRRANIVHLVDADPALIEACIDKFRESGSSTKGLPVPNDYPSLPGTIPSPKGVRTPVNAPPQVSPAPTPVPEIPQDPRMIARLVHLADPMTAAQYVGYIAGRFSRARALHLCLLSELASESYPSTLVSPNDRIFSKEYFFDSIPVSTYSAIIPLGSVFEELKNLLDSETGQVMRICDASERIKKYLRPRSSRNRSRMHKNLSTLVSLGCLAPVRLELDADTQATTYIDVTSPDAQWDYFKLTESVPVYRFADKDLEAPFCYDHQTPNVAAGVYVWEQLRVASQHPTCNSIPCSNDGTCFSGDPKLLKAIRRSGAWESEYVLSLAQQDYLFGLVDVAMGQTPLDDQNSARFDNACFVTAAPADAVSAFFAKKRADIQRDQERARQKAQQQANDQRRMEEEARHALAVKAAKAKKDQESRWDGLVKKAFDGRVSAYPQLQKALASLKSTYMVTPQPASESAWEAKIRDAVRDSIGAKQFVIAPAAPKSPQNVVSSQHESDTAVSTLILRQGQPIAQKDIAPKKSGRKSKKQLEAEAEEAADNVPSSDTESRRRRFPWNPEYDELARDAGAIIRVRCRGKRMDWSALEQVFPGVQRNSVRQRISNLETLPGAAAYFRRLDEAWTTLWLQHRGSAALPDPNPDSVKDFDLATHVTFLRQHIDKTALRVGAEALTVDKEKGSFALSSLDEMHATYIVNEQPSGPQQPTSWDFYFDMASEEPREREFLNHPFVLNGVPASQQETPVKVCTARAAIKMVMSTPAGSYNSNDAAELLNQFGEDTVKTAVEGMKDSLDMKRTRADKREPGRKYAYSDLEILRLKGDFASSMYPDAASMRENLDNLQPGEWINIGLTDEDGEVAAFLELVSDDKLDVGIDTSNPRAGREHLGSQSKKVDDENLEAQLAIRLKPKEDPSASWQVATQPDRVEHMITTDIGPPCAHASLSGPYCAECLQAGENRLSEPTQLALIRSLRDAGPLGLPIPCALELVNSNSDTLLRTLSALITSTPRLVYILGYDQARIVSAFSLSEWIVEVTGASQLQSQMTFPRRWLDISGNIIESVWTMALRTVSGAFMYRPSMSEYVLRTRYQGLFDRQELNEILVQLLVSGKLKRVPSSQLPLGMTSLEDEKATYWSLSNDSAWF